MKSAQSTRNLPKLELPGMHMVQGKTKSPQNLGRTTRAPPSFNFLTSNHSPKASASRVRKNIPSTTSCLGIPVVPLYNQIDDSHLIYIQIHILSNYGNRHIIGCSEIDALDDKSRPIPIVSINFEPNLKHLTACGKLVNSSLIKDDDADEWSAAYNPDEPIKIEVAVATATPPANLRIWNSHAKDHRSIKNIKIMVSEEFISEAEIPESFGSIISLKKMKLLGDKVMDLPMKLINKFDDALVDQFGEIPAKPTLNLRFEILEQYAVTEFVGLNAIEIVTVSGKIISLVEDIAEITVDNVEHISAPQRLIRSECGSLNIGDMWVAKRSSDKMPIIHIYLKQPIFISLVRIWNVPVKDFIRNFGVKKIKMYFDEDLKYIGRIKMCEPIIDSVRFTTNIWMTDIPYIRGKAKSVCVGFCDPLKH